MRFSCVFPLFLAVFLPFVFTEEKDYKVVCYYGSWAKYRQNNGQFEVENINPNLCTHVVYQYAGIASDNGIAVLDSYLELDDGLGNFRKFVNMKKYNKDLKLLIGVGGFNEGPHKYSRMAASAGARTFFINSVLQFITQHGFDGVSLDWMYPGTASLSDRENFVVLLKEFHEVFTPRKLILGTIGRPTEHDVERGYNIPEISRYVDFVSLMSFDYHGSWNTATGHTSPLVPTRDEVGEGRKLNQKFSVDLWLKKGMNPKKLMLSIPTAGRTFLLQSPDRNSVGAPSVGAGPPGKYSAQAGSIGFNELMEYFRDEKSLWTIKWDEEQRVPFAYRGNYWVSYDNKESAKIKAEFILQQGLGGATLFALETEDFLGISGESYPLLNVITKTLASGTFGTWAPPTDVTEDGQWKPPTRDPNPVTHDPSNPITKPPIPGNVVCKGAGSIKHPTDCSKYYTCVQSSETEWTPTLMVCPSGLGYDEKYQNCNYIAEIPGCT